MMGRKDYGPGAGKGEGQLIVNGKMGNREGRKTRERFWVLGAGFKGSVLRAKGKGKVPGSGFRVQRFRVKGEGRRAVNR